MHLVLLVFEAVLEVVCVSLPGYIAARQGMFDAEAQKLVANLNVALFTPCLSMDALFLLSIVTIANSRSLHEARVPAHGGEADGPRHHPVHLCRADLRLVHVLLVRVALLSIQEATVQLRRCHGRK